VVPVDVTKIGSTQINKFDVLVFFIDLESEVLRYKLLLRHVGKLVDALLICLGNVRVVCLDMSEILPEYPLAVALLNGRVICFAMLGLPLLEFRLLVGWLHVQK